MNDTVFVAGGGGFLGRNAIPALLKAGLRVVALQHRSLIERAPGVQVVAGSLADSRPQLAAALDGCTIILLLAGTSTPASSAKDPAGDIHGNLLPLLNLLDAASLTGIRRVVLASSGGTVYGRPQMLPIREDHPTFPSCPYGAIKLASEHLLRLWAESNGTEYRILRISNPYGPHQRLKGAQGVIGNWLPKAIAGEPLVVYGNGSIIRDYLYASDAADGLMQACHSAQVPSGIYNLSSGTGHSLLDIAAAIGRTLGKPPKLQIKAGRTLDVPVNILDSTLFRQTCGWKPKIELETGIQLTYAALGCAPTSGTTGQIP